MITPLDRLTELGLELPPAPAPIAAYVPARLVPIGSGRSLLHISGQLPFDGGRLSFQGRVPEQVGVEDARQAARLCGLNILAQVQAAVGLEKVDQVVQLTGFVQSTDDFQDHSVVINGASDVLVDVLGEAGRHARVAVGVSSLPKSAAVEIAAVLVVRAE